MRGDPRKGRIAAGRTARLALCRLDPGPGEPLATNLPVSAPWFFEALSIVPLCPGPAMAVSGLSGGTFVVGDVVDVPHSGPRPTLSPTIVTCSEAECSPAQDLDPACLARPRSGQLSPRACPLVEGSLGFLSTPG